MADHNPSQGQRQRAVLGLNIAQSENLKVKTSLKLKTVVVLFDVCHGLTIAKHSIYL